MQEKDRRMRFGEGSRFLLALLLCSWSCAGVSSGGPSGASGTGGAVGATGSGGTTGNPGTAGSGGSTGGGGSQVLPGSCSDAAKLVYVVSDQNHLYSFAPNKLPDVNAAFTDLGLINCAAAEGATVNSMAIDRAGTAYVNYTSGKIVTVNTTTLACADTGFVPGQSGFSPNLSMGFSSDMPGSSHETLYVSDNTGDDSGLPNGKGLSKVDLGQSPPTLIPIGTYTGDVMGGRCELTGTGDAKLFGFFTTQPAYLAQIDKTTAATPQAISLPTINATTGGYAFSFWGGSYWFYTASDTNNTKVTRYDPTMTPPTTTVAVPELTFTIVGAGVSTCAPVTFPIP
jgi:hypothetical protein